MGGYESAGSLSRRELSCPADDSPAWSGWFGVVAAILLASCASPEQGGAASGDAVAGTVVLDGAAGEGASANQEDSSGSVPQGVSTDVVELDDAELDTHPADGDSEAGGESDDGPDSDGWGEVSEDTAGDSEAEPETPPFEPPVVAYPDKGDSDAFYLSETGLYLDMDSLQLAPDLVEFEPLYQLWSDGALKRRWIRLPPGTQIDTSDMDHWQFPIGTMWFKEFERDGVRVETRLIARTGEGQFDYWMGAFVWLEDGSDAVFVEDGQEDALGTEHDVPKQKRCWTCHNGEPGHSIGLSALQLTGLGPGSWEWLLGEDLVTHPPADLSSLQMPGSPEVAAAFGYLHVNCGMCHNPNGNAWPDTDMVLRVSVSESDAAQAELHQSTVGVALQNFEGSDLEYRVLPGDPAASALLYRMTIRGPQIQMPPIASEVVDEVGVGAVQAWIESLGKESPAP